MQLERRFMSSVFGYKLQSLTDLELLAAFVALVHVEETLEEHPTGVVVNGDLNTLVRVVRHVDVLPECAIACWKENDHLFFFSRPSHFAVCCLVNDDVTFVKKRALITTRTVAAICVFVKVRVAVAGHDERGYDDADANQPYQQRHG